MNSPLALEKSIIKDNKIPEIVELHPRQKLAFLEEQLQQLKALHYRARIDMLHAARLQESDNPTLREKGLSNAATHRNEVQQTIGAIEMIHTLIEETKKEYGEVEAGKHPED